MSPATERPTLRRIADELGVSAMTVSNAYNRPDQLSADLRERVLATADRLGYRGPDPLARGLRRRTAGAVGIVYDTPLTYAVRDAAASAFLAGVCGALEPEGLGALLIHRDAGAVSAALVDGLIVYSVADDDDLVAGALDRRVPTVIVDQPLLAGVPSVGIDDRAAAAELARHLRDRGHERVGVVTFGLSPDARPAIADARRQRSARYAVSRARLAGCRDVLDWRKVIVRECPGSSPALGRAAAEELLASPSPPTAILAFSDALALGALEVTPAVVGFDDAGDAAERAGLTTIRQDHEGKGAAAARALLTALGGGTPPTRTTLPHELVIR